MNSEEMWQWSSSNGGNSRGGTEKNHEEHQSGRQVFWVLFKQNVSRLQVYIITATGTLSVHTRPTYAIPFYLKTSVIWMKSTNYEAVR
jgi:hypothetical protein